jgi:cyclomaltodextrinase / maltogenic alpha-amylase / neopullulanase
MMKTHGMGLFLTGTVTGRKLLQFWLLPHRGCFSYIVDRRQALNKMLEFFEKDEIDWSNLVYENFYKEILSLRKNNKALWNGAAGGEIQRIKTSSDDRVFAFKREKGQNMVAVILNLSHADLEISIQRNHPDGEFNKLFFDGPKTEMPSEFNLKAWEYIVYYR